MPCSSSIWLNWLSDIGFFASSAPTSDDDCRAELAQQPQGVVEIGLPRLVEKGIGLVAAVGMGRTLSPSAELVELDGVFAVSCQKLAQLHEGAHDEYAHLVGA